MTRPRVDIDLGKIAANARAVVELFRAHGVTVAGVTKGVCGHPDIARAMLSGGVAAIGESRMENVARLRAAGIAAPIWLLRLPALSQAEEVVEAVDVSLNSELATLARLSEAALRLGRVHEVIVMVELGDLREGVPPDDLPQFMARAFALPGVRVAGLGTNLACYAGVIPSEDNMGRLAALAEDVEARFGLTLPWVSGVNSSGLDLIAAGRTPRRVNHARIGEAILLGRETVRRRPWPGLHLDAFTLRAEVLEVKRKPSVPAGERGEDAFGATPAFPDRGEMLRALVNIGREDVDVAGLTPLDPSLAVLGASSGYLVLDATVAGGLRVGDEVAFAVNYGALLAAMTSGYVDKLAIGAVAPD